MSVSDSDDSDQVYQEIPGGLMDALHQAAQDQPDNGDDNGDDK